MGAFDPVEPLRAKPRVARKPKSLAEKMSAYIGSDTSETWPADTSRRYKEYLRASLAQKRSR